NGNERLGRKKRGSKQRRKRPTLYRVEQQEAKRNDQGLERGVLQRQQQKSHIRSADPREDGTPCSKPQAAPGRNQGTRCPCPRCDAGPRRWRQRSPPATAGR